MKTKMLNSIAETIREYQARQMMAIAFRIMEKAREFDPFWHAGFAPSGIIRLTP